MLCLKRLAAAFCALLAVTSSAVAQNAIRINEVLADNVSVLNGDNTITDWVELVNTSAVAVNLSGATLSDDELIPDKWTVPEGVTIPPNGYLVISFDAERAPSFSAEPFLNTGFNLNADGDSVYLYGAFFGPQIDAVQFGAQVGDLSVSKVSGVWRLSQPTPGAANVATQTGSPLGLRVNEWMAKDSDGDDWFEIFNTGTLPVPLEGLYFTDRLAEKTKSPVAPLTFIGTGQEAFTVFIADGNTNRGPEHVAFSLSDGGEAIGIFNSAGAAIDTVEFGAQAADVSMGRLPDGAALQTTFRDTDSPGKPNFKLVESIVVSELLSHTDPPLEDAVEFYNTSDAPVDISGWFLSNKESELKRYQIPAGTVIPARSYKVFYEGQFNFTNPLIPFNFNSAHGDQVYLAQADAQGNLTGFRVGEEFEAGGNAISFGRYETSVPGVYQFVAMNMRTFGVDDPANTNEFRLGQGAPNSTPRVGPVVINEVMFNPLSVDGFDNRVDEFIELFNTSATPVRLFDPAHTTNRWRLQNGVSFTFPANRTIPALGYALVVSFDPADQIETANFRARWNVPTSVAIYGPFRGDLNNNGDSLELYRPDEPQPAGRDDEGFVPYLRVDKVNYTDRAPWPTGADGTGLSLQRKNSLAFGNDRINWEASAPTPGAGNSPEVRDADADGAPDLWEDQNGFNKNDPADGPQNADGDRFTNVEEYIAGTNPRDAASFLKILSLTPAASETEPLKITFVAAANRSYSVLYRNSLAINSSWQRLTTVPAEPNQRVVTVEDPDLTVRTDRYYQIVTP